MVLLGGLELVAAGYILNEVSKDGKKTEVKRRRRRRDSNNDHHSHGSPNRPHHQSQSQSLRPPQSASQRPNSAPPPQTRPTWPLPSGPQQGYQAQQWQPHPQQQQYQHQQQQQQQWQPQPIPPQVNQAPTRPPLAQSYYSGPTSPPQQQSGNMYPPPGWHYNLRTGKLQQNMFPQEMQQNNRSISFESREQDSDSSSSEDWSDNRQQRDRSYSRHRSRSRDRSGRRPTLRSQAQSQMNNLSVPHPGYAELDAETPGRFRPYDIKGTQTPPPPYRA